jgi:hypothetical protein
VFDGHLVEARALGAGASCHSAVGSDADRRTTPLEISVLRGSRRCAYSPSPLLAEHGVSLADRLNRQEHL